MDFLNSLDHNTILFTLNSAGVLIPTYDFPEDFKTKITYLIKLEPAEVMQDNCESILMCGDISTNPIEDLKAITENVSDNKIRHLRMKRF